jgi:septin family protein
MPGWGDDVNITRYLRVVASFLLEQRIKDYERLDGGCNFDPTTMCGQLPHSITACLYFLPPHRTKKIDLVLMAAVSQLVPIIPVIAKADCMTDRELAHYRMEVQSMLQAPNKFTGGRNMPQLDVSVFQFSQAIIEGLAMRSLPLAVSCSRDVEPCEDPAFLQSMGLEGIEKPVQPVRNYKWGAVYPLNRGHSDLIVLKRLLLGDRVDSLYAMLDESYSRYVQFCGLYEENDKQLQLILQDACQVRV